MTSVLVVPTLNAVSSSHWHSWLSAVQGQRILFNRILIIDSSSDDTTTEAARTAGFEVKVIARRDFNHGGTRQMAVDLLEGADVVFFLTQDAILVGKEDIATLLRCFDDPQVGAAYGRQLPHLDAGPIAAHARLFNYPAESCIKSLIDKNERGIKTAFISNSFSAYRLSALVDAGGFPIKIIMNEDTWVAGKMLLAKWKVAYCAEARVYHSHNYTAIEEFKRYFDIGVFHSREPWLMEEFGKAEGEAMRFVISELRFLLKRNPTLIPFAFLRTFLKYLGYRLGLSERNLPLWPKKFCSMNRRFWNS